MSLQDDVISYVSNFSRFLRFILTCKTLSYKPFAEERNISYSTFCQTKSGPKRPFLGRFSKINPLTWSTFPPFSFESIKSAKKSL